MNISIENRVIWLAPERTAGKFLKEIFKNYGFFSCDKRNNFDLRSLIDNPHSNGNIIPEQYQDFQIITSIRNPYDRVWSCYVNYFKKNFKPKEIEENYIKFNEYVDDVFIKNLAGTQTDSFFPGDDYYNKWRLVNLNSSSFIRFENIQNDVMSLDFIKKDSNLFDHSLFSDKSFRNERFLSYNRMYSFESAKKVFSFYKVYFFSLGYDPFSFTNQTLTDEEKIKFLHSN